MNANDENDWVCSQAVSDSGLPPEIPETGVMRC